MDGEAELAEGGKLEQAGKSSSEEGKAGHKRRVVSKTGEADKPDRIQ